MASMGLLGALGGLGDAGVSVGKQMFLDASRNDLEERRMEYLLEKQKQLDEIAANRKNTERTEMVERVSGAKSKILEEDTLRVPLLPTPSREPSVTTTARLSRKTSAVPKTC